MNPIQALGFAHRDPVLEVRGRDLGWDPFFPGVSQCKAQLRGHGGLFLLGLLSGGSWEVAWAGPRLGDGMDQQDFVPLPSQTLFLGTADSLHELCSVCDFTID